MLLANILCANKEIPEIHATVTNQNIIKNLRYFPQETRMITLYLCDEIVKKQKYQTDSSYFIKTM